MMRIQQINQKIIITKKESKKMQKQQNNESYILSQNIIHKYQGKKVQWTINTHNRIVVIRQNQLIVLNANDTKLKSATNINTDIILKLVANRQNYIAILYNTGVLQIRNLDNLNTVLHLFNNIQFKTVRIFPLLYWEDDDLYILNQNKIQVFNIYKKERKVYSELIDQKEDTKKLMGIAQSHIIAKQRIIIMHLIDKIILSIAPIPIASLPLINITRILCLSNRKYKSQTCLPMDTNPPREYLLIVIDDRILQVYNLITMKQILQIQYQRQEQQKMLLKTDRFKQYLLVTFVSKKNKVKRNILYKVNTEQYYKGKQYFKHDSSFFQFQVQLHLKENLMIFPSKDINLQENNYITLDLGYHKYYLKKNNGEIVISTIILNHEVVKAKGFKNCKINSPQWKELRQWRDIITSYIQNKSSVDKFNQNLIRQQKQEQKIKEIQKKQPIKPKQPQKEKEKQVQRQKVQKTKKKVKGNFNKSAHLLDNKYNQAQKYQKLLMQHIKQQEQRQEQMLKYQQQYQQQYEKLKNSGIFNSLILNKTRKQQKQLLQLIKQCLNLENLQIGDDAHVKIQFETTTDEFSTKPSIYIQAYTQQPIKKRTIKQDQQTNIQIKPKQANKNQIIQKQKSIQRKNLIIQRQMKQIFKQTIIDKNKKQKNSNQQQREKKKLEKSMSKSSQQITKNAMTSKSSQKVWKNMSNNFHRVKSTTNQQQTQFFCQNQNKIQVLTKSQQNQSKPEAELDTQQQQQQFSGKQSQFQAQDRENLYIQKFTSKLCQGLTKAFQPLQNKLQNLEQKLARTQTIHIAQLRKCQNIVNRQKQQLNNIDLHFKGYFYQLLNQFDKNLQNGLKCYWNKIEQTDKKCTKNRDKAINDFGLYIDQQIKSRQQIFDHNRICIENNLTHLRKKMNAFMENQLYQNIYHQFQQENDNTEEWEHKYRNLKFYKQPEQDYQQQDNNQSEI